MCVCLESTKSVLRDKESLLTRLLLRKVSPKQRRNFLVQLVSSGIIATNSAEHTLSLVISVSIVDGEHGVVVV